MSDFEWNQLALFSLPEPVRSESVIRALPRIPFQESRDVIMRRECRESFRRWVMDVKNPEWTWATLPVRARIILDLPSLQGHDMACWCDTGDPCHADVLPRPRVEDRNAA